MYRLDRSRKKGNFTDLNIEACIIIFIVLLLIIGGVYFFASTPNSNYPASLFFIYLIHF